MRKNRQLIGILSASILVVIGLVTSAGAHVDTVWTRRYCGPDSLSDTAVALVVDSAGNVIVTGTSVGAGTGGDLVTVKYTPTGEEAWVRRLDGHGRSDDAAGVRVDRAGNVIVAGSTPLAGELAIDYLVAKYGPAGESLWVRTFDGIGGRADWTRALCVDDSGCVCITGQSDRSGSGIPCYEVCTVRYLPDGTLAWARTHAPGGSGPMASGHGVETDTSGCVYVTGDQGSFTDGIFDFVTIKYGPGGDTLWTRTYDSPGSGDDFANALAVDGSGNVIVVGLAGNDFATVKYDPDGNELWASLYDGGGTDEALALAVDEEGAVYVAGTAGDSFTVIKYDAAGTRQWVRSRPGARASDVALDDAANVYACGRGSDGYLTVKYDSAGTELWSTSYPGSYRTRAVALGVMPGNDVCVTGMHSTAGQLPNILTIRYSEDVGLMDAPAETGSIRPPLPTLVRGTLHLADGQNRHQLLDLNGRMVLMLTPGRNDLGRLSPGVYFIHCPGLTGMRKVIVAE